MSEIISEIEFYAPEEETDVMRLYRRIVESWGGAIQFIKRTEPRWEAESSDGERYGYATLERAIFLRDHPMFPHAIFSRVP